MLVMHMHAAKIPIHIKIFLKDVVQMNSNIDDKAIVFKLIYWFAIKILKGLQGSGNVTEEGAERI